MATKRPASNPKTSPTEATPRRLYRATKDRILGGVCAGLGDFFNIDPTIFRIIFVVATVVGGSGILIYIVLWLITPTEKHLGTPDHVLKENVRDMEERTRSLAHEMRPGEGRDDSGLWWGVIAIIVGLVFLFNNFSIFRVFDLGRFWPLLLVVLGIIIMMRRK